MSQKRFNEYQATLVSDDDNKEKLGNMPPGRYAGFDTITYSGSGSTFGLSHSKTGVIFTKANGTIQSRTSCIVSQSGVVIQEDSAITGLTLGTNVGNATARIDLIVMTHSYMLIAGGSAATYGIIQGTFGTYAAPPLTNAATQVIVGEIHIKPGATAVQALTDLLTPPNPTYPEAPGLNYAYYVYAKAPGSGNRSEAVLDILNKFTGRLDTGNEVVAKYITVNTNHVSLELPETTNTIKHNDLGGASLIIDYMAKPLVGTSGTRLIFKVVAGGADDIYFNTGYAGTVPAGYSKVKASLSLYRSYTISGFGTWVGVMLLEGDTATLEFINGEWVITAIQFFNAGSIRAQQKSFGTFRYTSGSLTAGTGDVSMTMVSLYNPQSMAISAGEIVIPRAGTYKITVQNSFTSPAANNNFGGKKYALSSSNVGSITVATTTYCSKSLGVSSDITVTESNIYIFTLAAGDKFTGVYNYLNNSFNAIVHNAIIIVEQLD